MPTGSPQLGLREQRKAETRARIVEAAVRCFTELGFNGASTRDIANRAGVGQGLISYHFESKESLWKEAVEMVFERGEIPDFETANGDLDDQQLEEAFVETIYHYAQHCIQYPDLAMLLYHEAGQKNERLEWLIKEHFIPAMLRLQPIYELGSERGLLRNMPFNIFAFSLTGVINTHFSLHEVYNSATGDDPRQEAIARDIIHHIANMFLLKPR